MPENIENLADFNALIDQDERVVAVDFWAPWCGPCQAFGPILDETSERVGDNATIAKLNIDDHPDIAREYGITSIPTVLYFRGGKEVDRAGGIETAQEVIARIDRAAPQVV